MTTLAAGQDTSSGERFKHDRGMKHTSGELQMSVMLEVYYGKPEDAGRERRIAECASPNGGLVTCREDSGPTCGGICLTIEFSSWEAAETAKSKLQEAGEHVEGPGDYGTTPPGED